MSVPLSQRTYALVVGVLLGLLAVAILAAQQPPPRFGGTYSQLDERSNRLAQALLDAGAGAGSRIAHLDRSAPEVIELLVAVMCRGFTM